MTYQEKCKLELDYDALNKNKKLENINISKEDYVNATTEIRNMVVKYLLAQDVINYYNQVKNEYTSKIEKIDRSKDAFYNHTCKNRSPIKRVISKVRKNK